MMTKIILSMMLIFTPFIEANQLARLHFTSSYAVCDPFVLKDVDNLRCAVEMAAQTASGDLLAYSTYKFEPPYITIVVVTAQAHITVHASAALDTCFSDIFIRDTEFDHNLFHTMMKFHLVSEYNESRLVTR